MTSVTVTSPWRRATSERISRPRRPSPWKAVGGAARLERAAAQEAHPVGDERAGHLLDLLLALHRARPGDDDRRGAADDRVPGAHLEVGRARGAADLQVALLLLLHQVDGGAEDLLEQAGDGLVGEGARVLAHELDDHRLLALGHEGGDALAALDALDGGRHPGAAAEQREQRVVDLGDLLAQRGEVRGMAGGVVMAPPQRQARCQPGRPPPTVRFRLLPRGRPFPRTPQVKAAGRRPGGAPCVPAPLVRYRTSARRASGPVALSCPKAAG
jgi:hypothetical protein